MLFYCQNNPLRRDSQVKGTSFLSLDGVNYNPRRSRWHALLLHTAVFATRTKVLIINIYTAVSLLQLIENHSYVCPTFLCRHTFVSKWDLRMGSIVFKWEVRLRSFTTKLFISGDREIVNYGTFFLWFCKWNENISSLCQAVRAKEQSSLVPTLLFFVLFRTQQYLKFRRHIFKLYLKMNISVCTIHMCVCHFCVHNYIMQML